MTLFRQFPSLAPALVFVFSAGLTAQAPAHQAAKPATRSASHAAPAKGPLADRIGAILADPALSGFVNGMELRVDGGWLADGSWDRLRREHRGGKST